MGSKARIKKEILPLILKNRTENQFFVDLRNYYQQLQQKLKN